MAGFSPESCPRDFDGVHVAYTVPWRLRSCEMWWEATEKSHGTIFARRATSKHWKPVSFGCYFGIDSYTYTQRRPPFGLPEILLIAPNSRSKMLRHVGSFAAFQTKQTGHGHCSAFLKLRSSRSASAFYIFLRIKTTIAMICEYMIYMIHIIHMIHMPMHSCGHITELHHARQRPSIPHTSC